MLLVLFSATLFSSIYSSDIFLILAEIEPAINLQNLPPGSSNSQDSFPPAGSNSSSMDGFSNGPHVPGGPGVPGPYPQYPPASEYGSHMQQRPPSQSTPGKSACNPLMRKG